MKAELLKRLIPMRKEDFCNVQNHAHSSLNKQAIPNRQMEAWRFTNINYLKMLTVAESGSISGDPSKDLPLLPEVAEGTTRIILTSEIDSVTILELPESIEQLTQEEIMGNLGGILDATGCKHHWPVALNYSHINYYIALKVKKNMNGNLEIVHIPTKTGIQAVRILLIIEEGSNLCLNQVTLGQGLQLSSLVLEVFLGRESALNHGFLAFADNEAGFLSHISVLQESNSHYTFTSVSRGWGVARLEPRITQVSGNAKTVLRGLQVVEDNNQIDTHSYVSFEGPEGELDQLQKSIADDKGHSIFNGIIRVPCLAQRTKASQLSRNLLLSSQARIDTKPELEIVADDVRCTHGATISQMQEDEIFYLQSRGLDVKQASTLVKKGYYQDILNTLPHSSNVWNPLERIMEVDSPLLGLYEN
ncbi:MAG TPA: SufD family Fe-S cluster assembly protein [Prochlorococcaceae cyanobacterium AMR_MDS_5431]|nr:SufD family Fe-S cluster assembly protein [Prochlorococcaceae cyanobacterium AMR_MDS_5431]